MTKLIENDSKVEGSCGYLYHDYDAGSNNYGKVSMLMMVVVDD